MGNCKSLTKGNNNTPALEQHNLLQEDPSSSNERCSHSKVTPLSQTKSPAPVTVVTEVFHEVCGELELDSFNPLKGSKSADAINNSHDANLHPSSSPSCSGIEIPTRRLQKVPSVEAQLYKFASRSSTPTPIQRYRHLRGLTLDGSAHGGSVSALAFQNEDDFLDVLNFLKLNPSEINTTATMNMQSGKLFMFIQFFVLSVIFFHLLLFFVNKKVTCYGVKNWKIK